MPFIVELSPAAYQIEKSKEGTHFTDREQTFEGLVNKPTKEMLVEFLKLNVVDREFNTEEELKTVLETWPDFAEEHNLKLHENWKTIDIHKAFCTDILKIKAGTEQLLIGLMIGVPVKSDRDHMPEIDI